MGKSCPLQRAQPLGGKLNETILISLRNGSDILPPSGGGVCRYHGLDLQSPANCTCAGPALPMRAHGEGRSGSYKVGCAQAEPAGEVLRKPPVEVLALVEFDAVFRPSR